MQVYRGLEIGTAKPSPAERATVPHHLIDIVDLTEPFDAAAWITRAETTLADIRSRGCVPILCGGTGLYFKALLEGLGKAPASDPVVRRELERMPLAELLEELKQKDPQTHDRIDKKNPRRVVRAVEVIRLSGLAYSRLRANWTSPSSGCESTSGNKAASKFFALARDREDLRKRIEQRIEVMFERGLVEETRRLTDLGLTRNRTAMQAIGYRQVVEHLRGERSLAETIALVKQRTWQFARRQMNWFRRQLEFESVLLQPDESPEAVAERLLGMGGSA